MPINVHGVECITLYATVRTTPHKQLADNKDKTVPCVPSSAGHARYPMPKYSPSAHSSDTSTTLSPGSHCSEHIPSNSADPRPVDISGPAHSMEIIDLTSDPDELLGGQVLDALVNLDENMEREIWKLACAFTGHDFAKTDSANPEHYHRFQGLGFALKPHQLWAITRILFTYHFEKTFGVLLADGMGVGKTFESSCGIILTPYIRLAAQDVKLDRKHEKGRHLIPSTSACPQGPNSECPSGTPTSRVASKRSCRNPRTIRTPRAVVPAAMQHWEQDTVNSEKMLLKLNGKQTGDNSHIIMIMPTSSALAGIQKESVVIVELDDGTEVLEPFFIKPGWVVMDEAHNQITENTIVWRFITDKLINRSASPTYLVSVSGTPIRRSPHALKPFLSCVTSPAVQNWNEPPSYNPLEDFDERVKESNWLVNHRGNAASADSAIRATYEQRFSGCKVLGKKVLKPYIIQRQSHYKFFGSLIIPLPKMNAKIIECSNFPGTYLEDIRKLANMSKEQLDMRLQKRLASWQALNHSIRGPRPTMENVISEIDRGFGSQGSFYELGLCATFPALAPMLLRGQPSHFRSQDIEGNLNAMSDADLREHALWPYLDTIRDGSQKMGFIAQKVQEMLSDRERHRDVLDPRRILQKKMITFAVSPMTAFLIAFILRKDFPSVRQTLVLAKDPPSRRGALYAPFCRMTDEEVLEDRDPEDPLILITTARISGEGFNLTRANYAIMTEPAFAKQVEDQAFHRVHRYGQQATTHLFTLYIAAAVRAVKDPHGRVRGPAQTTLGPDVDSLGSHSTRSVSAFQAWLNSEDHHGRGTSGQSRASAKQLLRPYKFIKQMQILRQFRIEGQTDKA
ncbi:hypothetical protein NPX13_g7415 [Xylaria arbuscula]|uniref:Helicase ATP-binding domain-containing protein n=1 Tax=Xylaria arbuscula TaxID=114810 RepID=A0A9W8NAN1_9PEZI|nr:hypothetical protein NPX13_g7415 [Xylaria arbuscula]